MIGKINWLNLVIVFVLGFNIVSAWLASVPVLYIFTLILTGFLLGFQVEWRYTEEQMSERWKDRENWMSLYDSMDKQIQDLQAELEHSQTVMGDECDRASVCRRSPGW